MQDTHSGTVEFTEGAMVVEGILFDYGFEPRSSKVTIRDAELVHPLPAHAPELAQFFAEIWSARAEHAASVARRFPPTA